MEFQTSLAKSEKRTFLLKTPEVSRMKVRGAIVGTNFELGSVQSKIHKVQPSEPKSKPKSYVNPSLEDASSGALQGLRGINQRFG
jgi:hypothetical protein